MDILACNAGLALGQDQTEPQFTEDGQGLSRALPFSAKDGKIMESLMLNHGFLREFPWISLKISDRATVCRDGLSRNDMKWS